MTNLDAYDVTSARLTQVDALLSALISDEDGCQLTGPVLSSAIWGVQALLEQARQALPAIIGQPGESV